MFGYVTPSKGELKIKNWNLYQAFYCGVCRSLGKRYGQKARLLLNYDTTFLAILLAGLKKNYYLKDGRCFVKMKKQKFAYGDPVDMAADINVLLAYYKSQDDWKDEKSIGGLLGKALYGFSAKKASTRHKEIDLAIREMSKGVELVESTNCQSPDTAAIPFREMMRALAEYTMKNEAQTPEIADFCAKLGKWIFIIDSFDDLESDIKKNRYNPNTSQAKMYSVEKVLFDADAIMCMYMQDLAEAYEKIKFEDEQLAEIVENVVFAGLLEKTESVLRGCSKFCKKRE